jgi:peptidyl-prolyl cis-trans isomerase B (cyclophilin B)
MKECHWYLKVLIKAKKLNKKGDFMFGLGESTKKSDYKEQGQQYFAHFTTNLGEFTAELYAEQCPETVWNFINLAEGRQKTSKEGNFYDGLVFHRVIRNFVIQGGCPNTREGAKGMPGTGGPGYKIDCELTGDNQYHDRGVLSMAHAGRNTGGSQFFVCHSRRQTAH